jgi:anti-sigma factor RsiW
MSHEFVGQACPEYEARLEDFLSGELSGAEKREVTDHIKACASCKAAMDAAQMSARLLRLMEASPDPGPAFSRIVMARIRAEQEVARQPRGFWQPFVSLAWRFAATAALAFVVMVTYDVKWHRATNDSNGPVAQQTQIRDLFTAESDRVPTNRDEVLLMVAETEHGK